MKPVKTLGLKAATAPIYGAVALQCQAADPGIARKPGGGNLVGEFTIHRLGLRARRHSP